MRISESVVANPVKVSGGKWRVVIGKPGQGSSGFYPAELWENYGTVAFPDKVKAFWKHVNVEDRDPRDQIGFYTNASWNPKEQVMEADLNVFKHWQPVVEGMGSHLELSINVSGEKDEHGNVTALYYDRTNTVDAVAWGGLEGSGVKEQIESLVESARAQAEPQKPSTDLVREKEETMEKEILEELKVLTAAVVALVNDSKAKAVEGAQIEADAEAAAKAAAQAVESYDAGIAVIEARREDLTSSQIESARNEAKAGRDVSALVESFVKSNSELKAKLSESAQGHGDGVTNLFQGATAWGSK